jgi:eukaryotic-like serine/threonine-protein kinase
MAPQLVSSYRLIESLGRGTKGEVFKAEDSRLQRLVALRILAPEWLRDPEHKARFFRDARAASRLDHPSFCTIFEISENTDPAFLAMAYIPGATLEERIRSGRLPLELAADIGLQLLSALQSVRSGNLEFEHLEPRNVVPMELPGGQVLAKITDVSFASAGRAARDGGIAAIGAALYRMITGRLPETGQVREELRRFCPTELAEIVERALHQDGAARLPSADEMAAGLSVVRQASATATRLMTEGPPPAARPAPAAEEPWRAAGPRYEDIGLIGQGGMGEVRRVWDRYLKRKLAMKILKVDSGEKRQRFLEEARTTARLQHPAIVPVHDIGTLADGRPFFTMKEVHGKTLEDAIHQAHREWGAGGDAGAGHSLAHLVGLLERACQGVAYAHGQGVLHRDLKPSNLMVGDFGEVLVLDWGLTRWFAGLESGPSGESGDPLVTRAGTVMGTPMFMSPEQASGGSRATTRSDVYSLGAVLYNLLSGVPPYFDAPREIRMPVTYGPPRELAERPFLNPRGPAIPPELKAICERAMARDPERRYASAGELAQALAAWLDGSERSQRAAEIVERASQMKTAISQLRAEAAALEAHAAELLASIPPFAPIDQKRPAWELQDGARALSSDADLEEIRFSQLLRGALTHADFPPAHALLAEHYRTLHAQAEAEKNRRAAARYEVLLRDHDDGRSADYLKGTGALTLSTEPSGARALLFRYEEWDRRLVPKFLSNLGQTPIRLHPLDMGSYLVKLSAPGRMDVHYPVFIERQQHWDAIRPGGTESYPIYLPAAGELGPEECYVAAGWFWAGGDPWAKHSLPAARLWLDGFIMARFPVTIAEYIEFLNDLASAGRGEEAAQHVPPLPSWEEGKTLVEQRELGVVLDASGRYRLDGPPEKLRWPVTVINWHSAMAYAEWRAARSGAPWRLTAEMEHEKAARAVDARPFPWGHYLDPTFCCMRLSHQSGRALKALVDEYPGDESPYGVRGLAGNVHCWCLDAFKMGGLQVVNGIPVPPDVSKLEGLGAGGVHRLMRGGSFRDAEDMCRAAYRDTPPAVYRDTTLGIRLARPLAPLH